ncbi:DUF3042 family protein [Secundilactobacillus malefermentans]|uniref:DUF3042 domain-containing protein n=1 Tax=Secundilactobacillus malefermentans TaxID=176292 RepID=A0A4R5NU19_9LACO|nr:DUF3042 family protein [Secundilactobacillus malefermentans]KRM59610.1 hypothetical protein FD44_GL001233 [Secundilactobacillus malefermentans DSM 5705 = KCTC 3548]QEA30694.1 DUF3042 family protein [Secundilactobacillus malefermentans]TDG80436.1 hypothetical protein C5L31_000802 [Secundilactobacillus malefermentans]
MKNFSKGFLFGAVATIGAVAGALLSFKKAVVEPIESEEQRFEDNRKKAMRKSRAAHRG